MSDTPLWVIYGLRLVGSSEYRYVGYTTKGIKARLTSHKYDARRQNRPVHFWLRKHPHTVEIDILEICPTGNMNFIGQREQFWIAACKEQTREKSLLNANDGGVGGVSRNLSEEHRRKISEALLGRPGKPHTKASKDKMSKSHTGVPLTDKCKETMSDGRRKGKNHPGYGKPMPDHVKEALAKSATGRVHSAEERKKRGDAQRGKPKKSAHTRYHTNRSLKSDTCNFCREDN